MSVLASKGIAFGLLAVAILATLVGLLPAQGIDWVYLGGFVVLGAAASVQGRSPENMAFLTAAALLIQGGINILELSSLTKLVNGAFFVLAVVRFPDGLDVLVKKKKGDEADVAQAPPQRTPFASGVGSGGAGGGSDGKTADQARRAQAVFEEFQAFTQAHDEAQTQEHEQGQKAAGDAKATENKKPRGSGRRRGRHSSQDSDRHRSKGKGPSRSSTSSGKPSRHRSSRDDEAPKATKLARQPRSASGGARSQEARDRLQAEQHALQREKERLAEEARIAERKRRQEEERLKREREALAKEREALKAQPLKPSSKPDTRSPEAVLGINCIRPV